MSEQTNEELLKAARLAYQRYLFGEPEGLPALRVAWKAADAAVLARMSPGWQPIATAPTNVSVLVWIENAEHYGPGVYRGLQVDLGTGRRWMTNAMHMGRDCPEHSQPTHWMPLPACPTPATEAEKP